MSQKRNTSHCPIPQKEIVSRLDSLVGQSQHRILFVLPTHIVSHNYNKLCSWARH